MDFFLFLDFYGHLALARYHRIKAIYFQALKFSDHFWKKIQILCYKCFKSIKKNVGSIDLIDNCRLTNRNDSTSNVRVQLLPKKELSVKAKPIIPRKNF